MRTRYHVISIAPKTSCVPVSLLPFPSFKAKKEFNSGIVEGLNYKIKLTLRKAYGYRELKVAEIAIYHALGNLPEPILTHRFC